MSSHQAPGGLPREPDVLYRLAQGSHTTCLMARPAVDHVLGKKPHVMKGAAVKLACPIVLTLGSLCGCYWRQPAVQLFSNNTTTLAAS